MPCGYPLPTNGDLLLAPVKVSRLLKDFVRGRKKLQNSFCKFSKSLSSLIFLLAFHWLHITRQEETLSAIIFLQDYCCIHDVIHCWPNTIIRLMAMQYKSIETYHFRDIWTFYKETKDYFCLHSIPGQADLFFPWGYPRMVVWVTSPDSWIRKNCSASIFWKVASLQLKAIVPALVMPQSLPLLQRKLRNVTNSCGYMLGKNELTAHWGSGAPLALSVLLKCLPPGRDIDNICSSP